MANWPRQSIINKNGLATLQAHNVAYCSILQSRRKARADTQYMSFARLLAWDHSLTEAPTKGRTDTAG